jgi:hypothetical protein
MTDSKPISILEAAPPTESGNHHAKMPKAVIAIVVAVLLIAAVASYFSLRRDDFPGYTYAGDSVQHDRIYINLGSMQFVGGLLHAKVLFKPHAPEDYDYQIADLATNCSGNDKLSGATKFKANGAPMQSIFNSTSTELSEVGQMVSKFACARRKDIVTIQAYKSGSVQPSDIENMTYVLGRGQYRRSIKFVNGQARRDTETYAIDKKSIVYGNLNGIAEPVAMVVMDYWGGGTGIYRFLIAVWNANGTPMNSEEKDLGDRTVVNSIAINNGIVTVDMLTQGPNDGACCPTQRKILRLALQGNQFVDVQ